MGWSDWRWWEAFKNYYVKTAMQRKIEPTMT